MFTTTVGKSYRQKEDFRNIMIIRKRLRNFTRVHEEQYLMNNFFKYSKLLEADIVYSRQKGATLARNRLCHNPILSNLMGYPVNEHEKIEIYITKSTISGSNTKNTIIKNSKDDKCLICGGKLVNIHTYYNRNMVKCIICDHPSYKTSMGTTGNYYFKEHGDKIRESAKDLPFNYENDWLKIEGIIKEHTDTFHNCFCEWTRVYQSSPELNVFLKEIKFKPIIIVNGWASINIKDVKATKKISDIDLRVLGWKPLTFKWGFKPAQNLNS